MRRYFVTGLNLFALLFMLLVVGCGGELPRTNDDHTIGTVATSTTARALSSTSSTIEDQGEPPAICTDCLLAELVGTSGGFVLRFKLVVKESTNLDLCEISEVTVWESQQELYSGAVELSGPVPVVPGTYLLAEYPVDAQGGNLPLSSSIALGRFSTDCGQE